MSPPRSGPVHLVRISISCEPRGKRSNTFVESGFSGASFPWKADPGAKHGILAHQQQQAHSKHIRIHLRTLNECLSIEQI